MAERTECEKQTKKRGCTDEGEKVAVIPSAHTVVDPYTVMVQSLDAVIADPAMIAPSRTPDIAGLAILDWHVHGCCRGGGQFDHDPVISRPS